MNYTHQIVQAAKQENVVDLAASFNAAMQSKVADALEDMRQEVAQRLFDQSQTSLEDLYGNGNR